MGGPWQHGLSDPVMHAGTPGAILGDLLQYDANGLPADAGLPVLALAPHDNGIEDASKFTVTYDPGTRKFGLTIAAGARYWSTSTPYTPAAGVVVTPAAHANVTGSYWLFYRAGVLMVDTTANINLLTDALLANAFFNTGAPNRAVLFDERHPATWEPSIWRQHHFVEGSQLISGGTIADYLLNDATAMALSIAQTIVEDESLRHVQALLASGGPYTIWYRSGAAADNAWNWDITPTVPALDDGDDPYYNQLTGGNWVNTAINLNSRWVNYWLCATNAMNDGGDNYKHRYVFVMGQTLHSTAAAAAAESFLTGIQWGVVPFQELVPLYQITYRRVSAPGTKNYQISAVTRITGTNVTSLYTTSPNVHNALSGRGDAGAHPTGAIATLADGIILGRAVAATAGAVQELTPEQAGAILLLAPSYEGRVLRPAQITASQNDYAPTTAGESVWLLTSDGSYDITGIAPPSPAAPLDGQKLTIINANTVAGRDLTFTDNDGASVAANRMLMGHDVLLEQYDCLKLVYDATLGSWRRQAGSLAVWG